MNREALDLGQMTDSIEMLEARTPASIRWFFMLLVTLLLSALAWSYLANMDEVVKSPSVIRPNEQLVKITNKVSGTVSKVYTSSGQHVNAGDSLYALDLGTLINDKERLLDDRKETKKRLHELSVFQEEFQQSNYSAAEDKDSNYPEIEGLKLSLQNIDSSLAKLNQSITEHNLLDKSISSGENLLQESSEQYDRFKGYQSTLKQYELQRDQLQEVYRDASVNDDYEQLKQALRQISNLDLQIDMTKTDLSYNVRKELNEATMQKEQLEKDRGNLLIQLQLNIDELKKQETQLSGQIEMLDESISERTVKAPIAGIINMVADFGEGEYLQEGIHVITIVPEANSAFTMQIAISHRDIGRIHVGDPIKYNFSAYPSKEYGHAAGIIHFINSDSTINTQTGSSYYLAEATIVLEELKKSNSEAINIKAGMEAEASIITDNKTILHWFLEKINFWN